MSSGDLSSAARPPAAKKAKKEKTVEQTYTKKTQLEHILLRPDTYVGSIERQSQPMWVLDSASSKIALRPCSFVPGLFKIFDEIVVNAADNKQRDPSMTRIEVTINPEENFIRVWNNGAGIPVVVHQEHGIYVPELIFGHLLTGSNFDDEELKTTGGRNGYGAKLANIFSTKFIVETADKERGLKFKQEFSHNMSTKKEPNITKHSGPEFTCITFYPDLRRFKMDRLDEDIVALLSKRVYDIAGTTPKLTVKLNGEKLEVRNFENYLTMYEGLGEAAGFTKVNDSWEVGVGVSDGAFQQVSYVNSICTSKGGCHVNYIVDQITARLAAVIKKKNKGEEVKPHQIKNHIAVFINCLIVNPAFDSQTKENLTTKASAFGSTCPLPEKLLKAIEKSSVVDNILNWAKFKQTAELKKKSGTKRNKLFGITKLDDANCAGTAKSSQCTLILTEGDSAKALAISGLGVVGRDYYGVFPLKGKLLNVREASHAQIMKNDEIQNITKILGLTFGKKYDDTSSLRYGHLMIMTDQDHDGSHIKGLLINFLHHFWPSLLRIDGFLQQFITPIVKCTKGKNELSFYTIPEYQTWKEANGDGRGWKIKYYKGLGTSTAAEAKQYFSDLGTHEIDFAWDERADDVIDMAFAKKRVEDRKLWLLAMQPGTFIDYKVSKICYDNFVNHELILFSHADNERSIAHFMDGMKPSQRKVLFACFKRNLRQEIKVAQLAGYISEHSAYHHGEASLTQTIIGMAQNFVGSNNINLLSPCGQFGTRIMGGKDAASPRYVFTKLETITRNIFHPDDDALLEYLDEDGQSIEPVHYVPIIPMILVNGSEGIGTGWSSSVPTYNPREIIANLRLMIAGSSPQDMLPWFKGFTGTVEGKTGNESSSFIISGTMEQVDDQTVVISELPVGKWTTDYKQYLESVLIGGAGATAKDKDESASAAPTGGPFIKDFKENHTDTTVLFTVSCPAEKLNGHDQAGLMKKFKLEGSVATTNMNLFDINSQIRKYESPLHVLKDFFTMRLAFYDRRKAYLIQSFTEDWEKLDNKVRFLLAAINNEIVIANRRKQDLLQDLKSRGFKAFSDKKKALPFYQAIVAEEEEEDYKQDPLEKGYDYLLSMKLWSLTMEKVNELKAERTALRARLDELVGKTSEQLWLEDLDQLEVALDEFDALLDQSKKQEQIARKKTLSKLGATGKAPPIVRKVSLPAPVGKLKVAAEAKETKPITSYFAWDSTDAADSFSAVVDLTADSNDPIASPFSGLKRPSTANTSSPSKKPRAAAPAPKPRPAAPVKPAAAKKPTPSKKSRSSSSESDSDSSGSSTSSSSGSGSSSSDEDSSDGSSDEEKPTTAKRPIAAPVVAASPKKTSSTATTPSKRKRIVVSSDEDESDSEDDKPAVKKTSAKPKPKPKPVAAKKPPATGLTKGRKQAASSSDEEVEIVDLVDLSQSSSKPQRRRSSVSYSKFYSDEEAEDIEISDSSSSSGSESDASDN